MLSRIDSLQRMRLGSQKKKKEEKPRSSIRGKVKMAFFFDQDGPLLIHFLQQGTTVNAKCYSQNLTNLHQVIKTKRPGNLTRNDILLHGNPKHHTVNTVADSRYSFRKSNGRFSAAPPYSPDVFPSDYAVFSPLRKALRGKRFTSDDDVQLYMQNWFTRPREFCETAIHSLVSHLDMSQQPWPTLLTYRSSAIANNVLVVRVVPRLDTTGKVYQ